MVASKDTLLSSTETNSIQKNHKTIRPYYLIATNLCSKGHNMALYNRADGRCGRCHTLRNVKYRKTPNGKLLNQKHEERRRNNPNRRVYLYLWHVRKRIGVKQEKILELEKELAKYDKENSN